jgi:phosphate-selective porin
VSHVVGAANSEVTLVVDHANDVRTLAEENHHGLEAQASSPPAQISQRLFSDDSYTKKTDNDTKINHAAPAREEENPLEQIIQAFSCGNNNTGVEADR